MKNMVGRKPARGLKKWGLGGKRWKTLETKQKNSKPYECYKEESPATAPPQCLSIMPRASDLKDKKVTLQRNMIADH